MKRLGSDEKHRVVHMVETTKTMEAMKSVAASQMREEVRKRTIEATKSVAEENARSVQRRQGN